MTRKRRTDLTTRGPSIEVEFTDVQLSRQEWGLFIDTLADLNDFACAASRQTGQTPAEVWHAGAAATLAAATATCLGIASAMLEAQPPGAGRRGLDDILTCPSGTRRTPSRTSPTT
jgi:hypothetical protein